MCKSSPEFLSGDFPPSPWPNDKKEKDVKVKSTRSYKDYLTSLFRLLKSSDGSLSCFLFIDRKSCRILFTKVLDHRTPGWKQLPVMASVHTGDAIIPLVHVRQQSLASVPQEGCQLDVIFCESKHYTPLMCSAK